ncbi:hypothetical protein [Paenibacillus sp. NFR01]|uniref:hypothetical protein n=1 Tax=Paenibacillus sp. NFR01 TaxID=1566279 RepID=UPI0008BBAEF2|nr:hypothetical protein [Paenibacillus sp. NFR01]SET68903.1 hypothetical protein SAMN03159358_2408 [Paenibacillus sp. NFR01]
MSRRIQVYFRNEDEAEGAKTALIPYGVENIESSALTDPLDAGGRPARILIPFIPYNNAASAASGVAVPGGIGPLSGGAVITSVDADDPVVDDADGPQNTVTRGDDEYFNGDYKELRYVMEVKVPDERYHEVVEVLRGKHGYVEVFE